jgi:hypothetical protein
MITGTMNSSRKRLLLRRVMAATLLIAILPNALFLEHFTQSNSRAEASAPTVAAHAEHRGGGDASPAPLSQGIPKSSHCHVGPESCAASSGLSNAIVISAMLALTLLGGGVFLLNTQPNHVSLFDLTRRLIVPPRMNLLSV